MSELDELRRLLGEPAPRPHSPSDWAEVEKYLGSSLPTDYKAFMDAYGSGIISEELVVFHPQGSTPLLPHMCEIHERASRSRKRRPDDFPHPFHPEENGLIHWGYDFGGDEHFFLPCSPDPNQWKVVTAVHGSSCVTFDGAFLAFILDFVTNLQFMDEAGNIGPATPSFESA
ncbi:SMI1/KNR4 family protein [Streptomyces sp. SAS_267]|uniref:SMI1/KNR4 family protein n=1 Tax=Streptomyces sp. SAS_267 TaxID=3412750 RepID=UPI00403C56CF